MKFSVDGSIISRIMSIYPSICSVSANVIDSRNLKPLSDSQEGGHPGWCDIMRSRLCIFTWLIANGICEVMPCACPQLFPSADILKRNQYWQRIIRKEDILYLALSASW